LGVEKESQQRLAGLTYLDLYLGIGPTQTPA